MKKHTVPPEYWQGGVAPDPGQACGLPGVSFMNSTFMSAYLSVYRHGHFFRMQSDFKRNRFQNEGPGSVAH